MKIKIFFAAALCAVMLTGCLDVKNAPPNSSDSPAAATTPAESAPDISSGDIPAVTDVPGGDTVPDNTVVHESEPGSTSENESEPNPPAETSAGESEAGQEAASKTEEETEETEPTVSEETDSNESEGDSIDSDYRFNTDDDFFFIVNKEIFLPDDYYIETDYVQGSYEMEKTAAKHCREMIEAAEKDGIKLKVLSAYRTVSYQKRLFERNVKSRMEDYGMSYEEAYYDTSINIAPPGGSEHNAGLAADIIREEDWDTYEAFEDTEEFEWLTEHAHEYGFILRYLKGKEDITGYIYEPWHFRYVGVKYAEDVKNSGLCLEEYFEQYVWSDGGVELDD